MTMAARRIGDDDVGLGHLSAAEREVATLAASGLTNAAIAEHRGTAVRTVANQMASVLRKLGAGSRRDMAPHLGSRSRDP